MINACVYVYIYIHTHIHTYIHTYIHAYMHAYMHTCIHAYMHTCIHAYMHTYIHAYIHTYIHTCIHAYIHTYLHTCIHTYMHACMHACIHTYMHTYTCMSMYKLFNQEVHPRCTRALHCWRRLFSVSSHQRDRSQHPHPDRTSARTVFVPSSFPSNCVLVCSDTVASRAKCGEGGRKIRDRAPPLKQARLVRVRLYCAGPRDYIPGAGPGQALGTMTAAGTGRRGRTRTRAGMAHISHVPRVNCHIFLGYVRTCRMFMTNHYYISALPRLLQTDVDTRLAYFSV